ncbi:MAG: FeoB-associated Cys-rich membrane protein [Ruminococcaceae bacterium]|nr:FeoB-associated Cys-rich membrane protein [Oscillospiraceae bacterium]
MIDWIVQYGGTVFVVLLLAFLIGVIVYSMQKDKKAGKSSCGSSCAGCPMKGECHKNEK